MFIFFIILQDDCFLGSNLSNLLRSSSFGLSISTYIAIIDPMIANTNIKQTTSIKDLIKSNDDLWEAHIKRISKITYIAAIQAANVACII